MKRYSQPLAIAIALSMVLGGVSSVLAQEVPTLTVTLSPDPSNGQAPLSGVDLNAVVSGTATGPINYTFYCNRSDNGTNLTGTPATSTTGASATTMNAVDACSYSTPGTYSGKVVVERNGLFAEARTSVTVTEAPASPTLSVALVATPATGVAPLSAVDLTATLSGTATGPVNYTFYCDRSDNGTNLVGTPATSTSGATAATLNAVDACTYGSIGTYTGKVIVERQGVFAEARATITATQQPVTPPSTTTPPIMQKGEWKLEIGPAGRTLMRGNIESVTSDSIKVRTWGGVWTVRVLSGAEIIPRVGTQLFDLTRFQPGDYVGINGSIVRDLPLTIDARVIRNWTEKREIQYERKVNQEFLKRLIKDDRFSDSLSGRVFEGTVGSITGTTFTLSDRGVATTIETNASTRFVDRNYATIALGSIKTGDRVRVYGDVTSSSSILAQIVRDTSLPVVSSVSSSSNGKNKSSDDWNSGKGKSDDKNKNKGKGNSRDDD